MSGVCGSLGTKFYMIQMTRPCPTLVSPSRRKYSTITVGHIYCALETSTTAVNPCRRFQPVRRLNVDDGYARWNNPPPNWPRTAHIRLYSQTSFDKNDASIDKTFSCGAPLERGTQVWPIGRNMVTTHIISSRLRLFRATSLPRNVHGDDSSADDNDNRCCLSCAARRNQSTDPPEASSRWVAIFCSTLHSSSKASSFAETKTGRSWHEVHHRIPRIFCVQGWAWGIFKSY
jgi:hypothetical protein